MDVSKEKYIMANIKIPIEIIENKKCRLFIDSLHINFTSIAELPESITDPVIKQQTQDTLQIFFKAIFPEYSEYDISDLDRDLEKDKDLNKENMLQLYIEKDEIKKMKKPTNTTFKIYNKNSRKQYTSKNYDNNGR